MAGQPNFSFNNAGYTDPISHAPVTYFLITSYNTANSPAAGAYNNSVTTLVQGYVSQAAFQAGASPLNNYTLTIGTPTQIAAFFAVLTTSNMPIGTSMSTVMQAVISLLQAFLLANPAYFPNAPWLSGASIGT